MKRRILCGILSLVLLFSLLPTAAFAAGETESGLKASALTAKAGDEITVTYTVPNEVEGYAVSLTVLFDKTKVQLKSATPWTKSGITTTTSPVEASNTSGHVDMAAYEPEGAGFTIPAGTVLLTAVFTAQADVTGSAQFSVKTDTAIIADAVGDSLDEAAGLDNSPVAVVIPITDPNAISATVAAPVKGQPLATTAEVADDAPYTVATENHSFLWFEGKGTEGTQATGSAKPNQVYTVCLTLVAKEGESFDVASLNRKTNTAGWTIVTLGEPDAPTANKLWLAKIFQATEKAAKLGGTVTIDGATGGKAKFGDTLTANTTDLNYGSEAHDESTLQYQWSYYNGTGLLGATKTYTAKEADIGKQLVVTVKNANNSGSVTSDPVTIGKAPNNTAPSAIDSVTVTAETITILYNGSGYEFACVPKDEEVQEKGWQTDDTFSGLRPNSDYDVYVRVAATNTHEASPKSPKLEVKTDKATASDDLINTLKQAVTPYTGTYDGVAHNALNVTGLGTSGWSVQYSTDGNTYSDTMPQVTNVSDSKTVYVKFSNNDYNNTPVCEYNVFVTAKSITSILPNAAEQTYRGSALTTTVSPKDYLNNAEYALVENTDYTVDYTGYENINVASGGKFKLKGVGNYTGEKEWTFKINPKSISDVAIDPISAMDYANRQLCPDVTVTGDSGKMLTKGTDYTVIYGANKNADEGGSVTVKAAAGGNYSFDDVPATFTINKIDYNGTKEASDWVRSNVTTTDKTLDLLV